MNSGVSLSLVLMVFSFLYHHGSVYNDFMMKDITFIENPFFHSRQSDRDLDVSVCVLIDA